MIISQDARANVVATCLQDGVDAYLRGTTVLPSRPFTRPPSLPHRPLPLPWSPTWPPTGVPRAAAPASSQPPHSPNCGFACLHPPWGAAGCSGWTSRGSSSYASSTSASEDEADDVDFDPDCPSRPTTVPATRFRSRPGSDSLASTVSPIVAGSSCGLVSVTPPQMRRRAREVAPMLSRPSRRASKEEEEEEEELDKSEAPSTREINLYHRRGTLVEEEEEEAASVCVHQ